MVANPVAPGEQDQRRPVIRGGTDTPRDPQISCHMSDSPRVRARVMKSIRSLIVGLVIAAAFAISLIGASAASAQIPTPSDAGVLVFHGGATLGGTIPGGVPPATGGSGSFSFEGDADASLVISDIDDAPEPGDPVGFVGHIHATGSYQNIVCGTGNASGDATVGTDDGNVYAHFQIVFVAGVGVLLVDTLSTDDGDVGAPLPETGAGVVLLSNINNPGQPDECTGDTTGFQINGAASLVAFDPAV